MAKMGGARVFFTVLAQTQVDNLISDSRAASTIMESVYLDSIESITEGLGEMFDAWNTWADAMVDAAMEVETAKIHFRKFFDENMDAAIELENQLIQTGLAFGTSAQQSIESGAQMQQLSPVLGGKEAGVAATQGAMLLGAVGMMDTDVAMKNLMQLQMQTNFMYEGAERLAREAGNEELKRQVVLGNTVKFVDMLNEAENKTGATIQGITMSMSQYAASAQLANMEMSEQVALSAALIEQGEEQGKSGRAIKMMLARIASDRSDNNALLAEHGVLVKDEQGNMRGLMDIMTQLKTQTDQYGRSWDNLTSLEKNNIAIAIAGSHHYVRFLKLMENYNRVGQIQTMVMDSSGSATEEFSQFTKSAAFDLQRYNNAIERQAALTGELLIPATLQAAKAEFMFAQMRNRVLETFLGERGAMFMEMAGVGFEHASGLLQAAFTYRMLSVAMQTHMIVAGQVGQRNNMTTKAIKDQIQANIMNAAARDRVAQAYANGMSIQQIQAQMGYSQIQIENAINNAMVARAKNEKRMHISGMEYESVRLGQKRHFLAADARELRNNYILDQQEVQMFQKRIKEYDTEFRARQMEIYQKGTIFKTNHMMSNQMKENLQMTIARMRSEQAVNRIEQANLQSKLRLSAEMAKVDLTKLSASEKIILAQILETENTRIQTIANNALNESKAVSIKLDQTKAATQLVETKVGYMAAKGDLVGAQAQNQLNLANMRGMAIAGPFTSAMMLASFAVSFFGDESQAAEASMYLMMAAMLPLTLSMLAFGGAASFAAKNVAIATLGVAVVAGMAAYAIAGLTDEESKLDKEMQRVEQSMKDAESQMQSLNAEMAKFEEDANAGIISVEQQMANSVDAMNQSIEEFDDKRQEIFFGGRTGRMNAALFRELKQVGVEQLYYSPEINVNMNNTFNGFTYEQAVSRIADLVEERLNTRESSHQGSFLV